MDDPVRLVEKIQRYFAARRGVVAVYLFGSRAAGRERQRSDVDLGIVLDGDQLEHAAAFVDECIVAIGRILRKDVHPVILNVASEELLRQIFQKGRCVAVNDIAKLSRFRTLMYSRIADFGQYRDQAQQGLIRRVLGAGHIG